MEIFYGTTALRMYGTECSTQWGAELGIKNYFANNYFGNVTKTLKLIKHPNFDDQSLPAITEYLK